MLFDNMGMDFLCENNEKSSTHQLGLEKTYMNIFHDYYNFLKRNIPLDDLPPNARENLEVFTWYFRLVVRSQLQYQFDNFSMELYSPNNHFATLKLIESKLLILYAKHFVNLLVKEQKNHGQFYTLKKIMRFMWDQIGKRNRKRIEIFLRGTFQTSSNWEVFPQALSVLDDSPCTKIGSFLCEFDQLSIFFIYCSRTSGIYVIIMDLVLK
ncbi:unnamed protein product [Rhizophagus irregularis]|nr:unnamed protein product [Rhizophagus irregularis]